MNPWWLLLLGWLVMAVVMALLWLVQRRTGDAGIVDVAWGAGVGSLAVAFAMVSDEGDVVRRTIVALLAGIWAARLSGYVLQRVMTMPEDGRYQTLKEQWGAEAQRRLFWFYQYQAFGSVFFAVPMLIAARNPRPLGGWDFVGVAIWILAILGETIADRQLDKFRHEPGSKGKVCQTGLWKYSRHPNYFFEWLHWWSYFCLAITGPWGWLSVLAPLAMYYFITQVTGIPPTEQQSLKSRGDAYREYQRTTSPFFPWWPKAA